MNKTNQYQENQRLTTLEAVEALLETLQSPTQSKACLKIYNIAKQKHQKTGFPMESFNQFHQSFRNFKSLELKKANINQ